MYILLNPTKSSDCLGCWHNHLSEFGEIVGYSALGLIFLRNQSGIYMILHPLKIGANAKKYGPFSSVLEFESSILKDSYFVNQYLRPQDLETLEQLKGKLQENEIYYPNRHAHVRLRRCR